MKKILILSSLLAFVFSCKDKEEYYRFTDDERKLIPKFKNGDTIKYFSKDENSYDRYIVQQIESRFNVEKSLGYFKKKYYEIYNVNFSNENNPGNTYKIQMGKNENGTSFSIYWNVFVDTKKTFPMDTIEAFTENTIQCDTNSTNPSNGTFKKLYYLKQKGIISFEDCVGKTWKLEK